MNLCKRPVKFPFFVFWKKHKYSPLPFMISIILLFPFNSFAGKIFDFKKIREIYERWINPPDFMVFDPHATPDTSTSGTLKAMLRFHNEDLFLEDATVQEISEYFKFVFERTEKGTLRHAQYKQMIFNDLWEDREFRTLIFDSITKEDLTKPDFLLKWWEEAKTVGAESRLVEYTELSLKRLRSEKEPDQFLETALQTARKSLDFREEWNSLVKKSDSSVIEQDFDVIFPDRPISEPVDSPRQQQRAVPSEGGRRRPGGGVEPDWNDLA